MEERMYLHFFKISKISLHTNKGCGGVVSTPSSLTKRSRIRAPLGTELPLLGSALPPM